MKENRIITEAHQEQQILSDATLHLYDKNRQNTLCFEEREKKNKTERFGTT